MKTLKEIGELANQYAQANPDTTISEAYRQGYIDCYRQEPGSTPSMQYEYPISIGILDDNSSIEQRVAQPTLFDKEPSLTPSVPTFQDFWNAYNYKLSRKPCEKKWNALPLVDKIAIMEALPKYDAYLLATNYPKKHPLTYLNQECWNDEYPVINNSKPTAQDEELAYLQQQAEYLTRFD